MRKHQQSGGNTMNREAHSRLPQENGNSFRDKNVLIFEARKLKGREIARDYKIEDTDKGYRVQSQSGAGFYYVKLDSPKAKCTCHDFELRQEKCKHIFATEFKLSGEIDKESKIFHTKLKRKPYRQVWSVYTKAQTKEQGLFMQFLADLCKNVEQPEYEFGRPTLPYADMVFACALKVYSTFSLRRFCGFMQTAAEKGYIEKPCCYASVSNFMRKEEMAPILDRLIKLSGLPLAAIETKFAVDSSGFSTSRFARYFSYKHQRDKKYKTWIKLHLIVGTLTNIVTGVRISEENKGDCPFFQPLVEDTSGNFKIEEVSADKAYLSRSNFDLVTGLGGDLYVPFKSNSSGKSRGSCAWRKMYLMFELNKERFLEHYHKRSNSESVFHMIKSKFRDNLRSKDKVGQKNELLLKILCHNLCCVIQESMELGINPEFCLKSGGDV